MLTNISDVAADFFSSGYYCAESVLLAVARSEGIDSPLIPRIATGFCSGVARTRGTCGALSGGILAISALLGRNTPDESLDITYDAVQRLQLAFVEKFGSRNCVILLGCDISTEEGQRKFRLDNLNERCRSITAAAAKMTLDAIEEWRCRCRLSGR